VRPDDNAAQDSELLFGETFTVYDCADGWAWGQAANDLYVGYLRQDALTGVFAADARVTALMAPVFSAADLKTPVRDLLPLNAAAPVLARQGDYVQIGERRWLHQRHLAPLAEKDFVAVAERFVGVPYVWGGKTHAGMDCSGLVQIALAGSGIAAPRDTDMQEGELGKDCSSSPRQRGDIVFWPSHVGIMLDAEQLLHANSFHMQVEIEPLAEALARIVDKVTAIKRF